MKNKIILSFLLDLVLSSHSAWATDTDAQDIEKVLMQQWHQPASPLTVAPIVIEKQFAIAGWVKAERGGRALLRKSQHGWEVFMCGGDDLTKLQVLEQAGIEPDQAQALALKLKNAEQNLSPENRQQLSIMQGVMPVEAIHHDKH